MADQNGDMPSWSEVEKEAPELAAKVRGRFDAHGLALLATLRKDGSPRISGIEPLFAGDHVWLGMMPGSRKAADLFRDPRFALHSATTDKQVTEGDAKLGGRAVPVDDDAAMAEYREAFAAHAGYPPPPGAFHLFRADVEELSFLRPAGDHLDMTWWREGGPVHRIDRF